MIEGIVNFLGNQLEQPRAVFGRSKDQLFALNTGISQRFNFWLEVLGYRRIDSQVAAIDNARDLVQRRGGRIVVESNGPLEKVCMRFDRFKIADVLAC